MCILDFPAAALAAARDAAAAAAALSVAKAQGLAPAEAEAILGDLAAVAAKAMTLAEGYLEGAIVGAADGALIEQIADAAGIVDPGCPSMVFCYRCMHGQPCMQRGG
jgi:hypothetical protein